MITVVLVEQDAELGQLRQAIVQLQEEKEAFCLGVIQAFAISHSHYADNINLRAMSLGFTPGYELSELDEIEAVVTPLAESLASKIEDMVLPRRGS